MYKKLLVLMMICNLTMHATDHHHHHTPSFIETGCNGSSDSTDDTVKYINDRLVAIAEEEKTQYDHTNHTYIGVATGIALLLCACLAEEKHRNTFLGAGIVVGVGSGGLGFISIQNENQKAADRKQERMQLIDRKIQLSKKQ